MGWANRLTIGRGILSLVLWALLHVIGDGHEHDSTLWWAAFGLFTVTAFTDVLDGWLARRYGEVSVFGRIADRSSTSS
jgi:phosphatidylglycerophosphate synthase